MDDRFVRPKELQQRLGLTRDQLYSFIRRGELAAVHAGRSLLISAAEADGFAAFLATQQPDPGRKRGAYCEDAPGKRCWCRCHSTARTVDRKRTPTRWDVWKPSHDDAIRTLLGTCHTAEEIAAVLSERFSVPRSTQSVRRRLSQLGLSIRTGWRTAESLVIGLGVHRRTVVQWEAQGLLERTDYGRWRRYSDASVERLVRSQAGVTINPRRVRDLKLKALAEISAMANRRGQAG